MFATSVSGMEYCIQPNYYRTSGYWRSFAKSEWVASPQQFK